MFICLSCLVNLLEINYKISYPNISLTVLLFLFFCFLSSFTCSPFQMRLLSWALRELSATEHNTAEGEGQPGRRSGAQLRARWALCSSPMWRQLVKRALRLVLDQEEEDVGRESIFSAEKLCLSLHPGSIELNHQSISTLVLNIYLTGSMCWTMFLTALSWTLLVLSGKIKCLTPRCPWQRRVLHADRAFYATLSKTTSWQSCTPRLR